MARHIHINHGQELETSIDRIQHLIWKNEDIRTHYSTRWLAIKYLENDSDVEKTVEALPNHDEIIAARFGAAPTPNRPSWTQSTHLSREH